MSSLVAWICCTDRIITTISLGGKLELSMWKKFEYRLILWTLRVGDLLLCHVLALQNPKSEPRTLKPPSNSLQKLLLILVVIMCIRTPNLATQTNRGERQIVLSIAGCSTGAMSTLPPTHHLQDLYSSNSNPQSSNQKGLEVGILCIRLRQISIQNMASFKHTHNVSPLQSNSIQARKVVEMKNKQRSSTLTTY